jgi:hypothetical protein
MMYSLVLQAEDADADEENGERDIRPSFLGV